MLGYYILIFMVIILFTVVPAAVRLTEREDRESLQRDIEIVELAKREGTWPSPDRAMTDMQLVAALRDARQRHGPTVDARQRRDDARREFDGLGQRRDDPRREFDALGQRRDDPRTPGL